jgi:hypothetical protein
MLSDEQQARLTALTSAGRHPARQLTRAHILLKANFSETGRGQIGRHSLLRAEKVSHAVDVATAGRAARRIEDCRPPQR